MKKLLKWGHGVGLLLPSHACKAHSFVPGTMVRVLILEKEIRIRHASLPREDEYTPFEQVPPKNEADDPW